MSSTTSTPRSRRTRVVVPEQAAGTGAVDRAAASPPSRAAAQVSAVIRLSLSTIFLWAFFDKLFGLGHETKSGAGWLDGGSPTKGFLSFATKGPLADFYSSFAGAAWADWLFMAGLLGIGTALLLGIAMRPAAAAGSALLVMMWSAVLPPANHVFMDDHLVYALVLVLLALTGAGRTLGLGARWERLPLVQRYPALA
jgi:thiosulfate dehydrogenase [quinone] large subunit